MGSLLLIFISGVLNPALMSLQATLSKTALIEHAYGGTLVFKYHRVLLLSDYLLSRT